MPTMKECRFCHEAIHADALKCRYCLTSQKTNWRTSLESIVPVLSIVIGLTSIATFLTLGAPEISRKILYNKAILKAEISSGTETPGEGKYVDIMFVNYGLKKAAISTTFSCYWHDSSGNRVTDKSGESYPELFEHNSQDTTIDAESVKVIRFQSKGGLPLSEEEIGAADLSSQKCQVPYTPLGDPTVKGKLQQFIEVAW